MIYVLFKQKTQNFSKDIKKKKKPQTRRKKLPNT